MKINKSEGFCSQDFVNYNQLYNDLSSLEIQYLMDMDQVLQDEIHKVNKGK